MAVQLIKHVFNLDEIRVIPVFGGGTSLSKAYNIIKRFSEDVDFKIQEKALFSNRSKRREYRDFLGESVAQIDYFEVEKPKCYDQSQAFVFEIKYPQAFKNSSLRPYLKLEFRLQTSSLPPKLKPIRSFVAEYAQQSPEIVSAYCISPVETAADKISALFWRVFNKDRTFPEGTIENDPTLIRHLYDLHALYPLVMNYRGFELLLEKIYKQDRKPKGFPAELTIVDLFKQTLDKLKNDTLYREEYVQYVDGMSYARDHDRISFEDVLGTFKDYIKILDSY